MTRMDIAEADRLEAARGATRTPGTEAFWEWHDAERSACPVRLLLHYCLGEITL